MLDITASLVTLVIQEGEIRRALGARQRSRDLPSRVLEGLRPLTWCTRGLLQKYRDVPNIPQLDVPPC